jgi:hypothetical protein
MSAARHDDEKPKGPAKDRRKRLDEALRANLAKRKAQARARRELATSSGEDDWKPGGGRE